MKKSWANEYVVTIVSKQRVVQNIKRDKNINTVLGIHINVNSKIIDKSM